MQTAAVGQTFAPFIQICDLSVKILKSLGSKRQMKEPEPFQLVSNIVWFDLILKILAEFEYDPLPYPTSRKDNNN